MTSRPAAAAGAALAALLLAGACSAGDPPDPDAAPFDEAAKVALPARKGTLVVLHGLLPHGSAPNTSNRSRMAYTLHAIDGAARWHPGNWLRRAPGRPFRGFETGS